MTVAMLMQNTLDSAKKELPHVTEDLKPTVDKQKTIVDELFVEPVAQEQKSKSGNFILH